MMHYVAINTILVIVATYKTTDLLKRNREDGVCKSGL
jgi:hypothetical protein